MRKSSRIVCHPNDDTPEFVKRCCVLLPEEYAVSTSMPIVYLLHGIGETERDWAENRDVVGLLDALIAERFVPPMGIVMPYGFVTAEEREQRRMPRREEFDIELAAVITECQARYPHFSRSPRQRAIAGISMGGKQAIEFALEHPEHFSVVGGLSAAIQSSQLPTTFALVGDSTALRTQLAHVFLRCGAQDALRRDGTRRTKQYDLAALNAEFATILRQADVHCDAAIEDGYHDWEFWHPRLAPMLTSIGAALAPQVAARSVIRAILMAIHVSEPRPPFAERGPDAPTRLRVSKPAGWSEEKYDDVLSACECDPVDAHAGTQLLDDAETILTQSIETYGDRRVDMRLSIPESHWRVVSNATGSSLEPVPWKSAVPSYARQKWIDDVAIVLPTGKASAVLATLRSTRSFLRANPSSTVQSA